MFLYLHGHKLVDLEREMFSRDVAQIIDLHSNILAPVTSCSSCKTYGMYLLPVRISIQAFKSMPYM